VILFVMVQFSLSGISVIPLAKISQPEAHFYKTRSLAATLRALAAIEEMKLEQEAEREALFYEVREIGLFSVVCFFLLFFLLLFS
jgi:hypothetical protein